MTGYKYHLVTIKIQNTMQTRNMTNNKWLKMALLNLVFFFPFLLSGQGIIVKDNGIGVSADSTFIPHSSAILDISSDSLGLLIPRMDSASVHNISSPAKGLLAYDTTNNYIWLYTGSVWKIVNSFWDQSGSNIYTSKKVGIGISAPVNTLECSGNINIPADSSYMIGRIGILNEKGTGNISVGRLAGKSLTSGTYNTFIGESAGAKDTSGLRNTFIGYGADSMSVSGTDNVAVGYLALTKDTGDYSTCLGSYAGRNSTGLGNVFIGYEATLGNTTICNAVYNVSIGMRANRAITTGSLNTSLGYASGYSTTSGAGNVFLGSATGFSNSTGGYNVYIGYYAGYSSQTTNYNVALGLYAGRYNKGSNNVFNGVYSGNGVSGSTTSTNNSFMGYQSGYSNTTGSNNLSLGYRSGYSMSTGTLNVLLGAEAGYNLTTGTDNVIVGYQAGRGSSSGYPTSGNVFLGYQSGYNETSSNRLYIENSNANSSNALIYGEFDNDVIKLNADVTIRDFLNLDQASQTSLADSATISLTKSYVVVAGSSAAVTMLTATPVANGTYTGQALVIQGNDNTKTVTINNSGNVKLSGNITLGLKDTVFLMWDGSYWVECSRSNN